MSPRIPLSVLDVIPLRDGSTARVAMEETVALARAVDALGYRRLWFAEHHGMGGIASSSPAVMIARVASETSRIRVGSGGVMLPNHSSLAIAEQFGTLEALFPGRIDLGLGRAPGTDGMTARVLRRGARPETDADFPQQLDELFGFFRRDFEVDHPYRRIQATPAFGNEPPVWLLGSSDFSARLAGDLSLPFAFAHHFSQENTLPALAAYRAHFRPSEKRPSPEVMLASMVVVADTDAEAQRLALPNALVFLRIRRGELGPYPTLEQAEAYPWTPEERRFAEHWLSSNIVGSPTTVRTRLKQLLDATQPSELMALCAVPDIEARIHSYTLLRELHDAA
ncbi:MAG: LLM class flavin-dependent oxidoreductase [Archangium sp.]|nr:LLM class flavin-dependent oxidoreductase [Archangium sp.]